MQVVSKNEQQQEILDTDDLIIGCIHGYSRTENCWYIFTAQSQTESDAKMAHLKATNLAQPHCKPRWGGGGADPYEATAGIENILIFQNRSPRNYQNVKNANVYAFQSYDKICLPQQICRHVESFDKFIYNIVRWVRCCR